MQAIAPRASVKRTAHIDDIAAQLAALDVTQQRVAFDLWTSKRHCAAQETAPLVPPPPVIFAPAMHLPAPTSVPVQVPVRIVSPTPKRRVRNKNRRASVKKRQSTPALIATSQSYDDAIASANRSQPANAAAPTTLQTKDDAVQNVVHDALRQNKSRAKHLRQQLATTTRETRALRAMQRALDDQTAMLAARDATIAALQADAQEQKRAAATSMQALADTQQLLAALRRKLECVAVCSTCSAEGNDRKEEAEIEERRRVLFIDESFVSRHSHTQASSYAFGASPVNGWQRSSGLMPAATVAPAASVESVVALSSPCGSQSLSQLERLALM